MCETKEGIERPRNVIPSTVGLAENPEDDPNIFSISVSDALQNVILR